MLIHAFNWKKLSICAALGYRWDDRRLIGFLREKHLRGQKAMLIWDGLPAHKSRQMKQYLEDQRRWLQVEMLPAYSPDLNPV